LDGLEKAIIGITEEFNGTQRVLYSKEKILSILMDIEGMEFDDAEEFYYFNIVGLYAGKQNPIFLETKLKCVFKDTHVEYKIIK
jgi:hypothetical protein